MIIIYASRYVTLAGLFNIFSPFIRGLTPTAFGCQPFRPILAANGSTC